MLLVITWYLALQLFALAAWPLAFSVCNRLFDRGYGLSKGFGLLLVTFITWVLAHLAPLWSPLGFSFGTVTTAWIIVLAISLASIVRNGGELWQFLRRERRYIISLELIFLLAFVAMVAVRATIPHISYHVSDPMPGTVVDHAAEKFTDFAILQGLLTSHAFPPHDAWVSGHTLNYYYFGHMLWAVLIKFCSVRPEIGFNLALAAAFALASSLSFALGYNLTRRLRWGLLTLFLVVLCSNLDGFLQFIMALKMKFIDSGDQMIWTSTRPWWRNYEFWRSSRAIAGTINEFPAFSFILADLHAHLSSLIINLCGWNLAVQMFRSVRQYRSLWRYEVNAFDELFLAALICGALSATNSWDVPLFTGVIALAMWCGSTGRRDPYAYIPTPAAMANRAGTAAEALVVAAIITIAGVGLLFYPFMANFSPPDPPLELRKVIVDGVEKLQLRPGSLIKMVDSANRSNPFEFFGHWVLLMMYPTALLIAVWRRKPANQAPTAVHTPKHNTRARTAAILLVVAAAAVVLMPLWQGWIAVALAAAVILLSILLVSRHYPPVSRFVLGLLLIFSVMTWFCEMFYLDDIFSGSIERINTVFKIYYGLWPLAAVATVLSLRLLIRFARDRRRRRRRAALLVAPLVLMGSPYIILGTIDRISSSTRIGHWKPPADSPITEAPYPILHDDARPASVEEALDGMRYLTFQHPDDYAAIMWVRANLPPDAILLEAAGYQYSYAGRFGTLTGRPSFAGWLSHAWGWRGSGFGDPQNPKNERDRRAVVTAKIYNEESAANALELLRRENIDYIIIGDVEREQYPSMIGEKFFDIGEQVFAHGGTIIYKVRK